MWYLWVQTGDEHLGCRKDKETEYGARTCTPVPVSLEGETQRVRYSWPRGKDATETDDWSKCTADDKSGRNDLPGELGHVQ